MIERAEAIQRPTLRRDFFQNYFENSTKIIKSLKIEKV